MDFYELTREKLSIDDITNIITSPSCGAISLFVGTTRDNFDGKTVVHLEYEAYESMALKAFKNICLEIRAKWPTIGNIAIYHRLGIVPVKEASIIIGTSSPHRAHAIQATNFCIDNVKKSATIWKKEIYSDETADWKQNSESTNPVKSNPKKRKLFKGDLQASKVEVPFIPPHLIQINVSNAELNQRIENFMLRKRNEIDERNIKEFCSTSDLADKEEGSCARVAAILHKHKNSKSHLQVNRILNTYQRDQDNCDYLTKFIPKNGVEERVKNLETYLSLSTPTSCNIYERLKILENRVLYMESLSPEYMHIFNDSSLQEKIKRKKIYTIQEIDNFIADIEKSLK